MEQAHMTQEHTIREHMTQEHTIREHITQEHTMLEHTTPGRMMREHMAQELMAVQESVTDQDILRERPQERYPSPLEELVTKQVHL